MNRISALDVKAVLKRMKNIRILVVGDIMLDQYWWGDVTRISQEAPIPVVEVKEETVRMGGAANVANNIKSLGANPLLLGLVGNDNNGKRLARTISDRGITAGNLICDHSRPTTTKTRIIGHSQHVVRVDHETTLSISVGLETSIIKKIKGLMGKCDAVILEDYNKGILTPKVIQQTIQEAKKRKKIVTVDPKFDNFFAYKGVTVFKPNLREIANSLKVKVTLANLGGICRKLADQMSLDNIVVTLSDKGMAYYTRGRKLVWLPALPIKVFDASGAGDTVIATLTACLAAGCDMRTAATLANHAGGAICQDVGVVPITPEMLLNTFK